MTLSCLSLNHLDHTSLKKVRTSTRSLMNIYRKIASDHRLE